MINLPQLHTDVAFGKSNGKIIWQPRIGCWYDDKKFAGEELPAPYTKMTIPEIFRSLGCSARTYDWYNGCFRRIEHPSVKWTKKQLNENDVQYTCSTPVGSQVSVDRHTPTSNHVIHVKWEVESEEELKIAAWREENCTWEWSQNEFDKAMKTVGDLGAPTVYMPRMNVQSLYIEKMGVEKGIFAIFEWPDAVEAYFRALEESHCRLMDVINKSPVNIINFGENVHAGTLSPDLFLKYHLPACQRRCEKLRAAGKFTCSHWDGDTKPLLPYAKETGLDGIEAITPKPQGDVTLEEVKEAFGDKLFLIDGIPAVYFDELYPVQALKACVKKLIDLFAPRLILGISDEISSTGNIERVRIVGEMVDEYNAKQ